MSLQRLHVGPRMSEIVSTVLAVGEMAPAAAGRPEEIDLGAWLAEHRGRWEKTLGRAIDLRLPERAVVANMAPEKGATTGYFPVDAQTLAY